jgi:hypothetical protein
VSTLGHLLMLAAASALDAAIFVFFYFVAYPPEGKEFLKDADKLDMLDGPPRAAAAAAITGSANGTTPTMASLAAPRQLPVSFHIDIVSSRGGLGPRENGWIFVHVHIEFPQGKL